MPTTTSPIPESACGGDTMRLSPASQVLNTPELLENILLRLSSPEAIRARRVCSLWKGVTESTKKLRQHVFLEAAPVNELLHWKFRPWPRLDYRPILRLCTELEREVMDTAIEYRPASIHIVRQPHPLLYKMYDYRFVSLGACIGFGLTFSDRLRKDKRGGWRDMFITQPPCRYVTLRYWLRKIKLKSERGITLGVLVDWVEQERKIGALRKPVDVDVFFEHSVPAEDKKYVGEARAEFLEHGIDQHWATLASIHSMATGKRTGI